MSWQEMYEEVKSFGSGLANIGVKKDSRIAIIAQNSDQYLLSFFAISWADAIIVPVNVRLLSKEIVFVLNQSEAELLLFDENFSGLVEEILPELISIKKCVFLGKGSAPKFSLSYYEVKEVNNFASDANRSGEKVFGIIYTGGTTGKPKGVVLSYHNVLANANSLIKAIDFTNVPRFLHVCPMFHSANLIGFLITSLLGGTHVVLPNFHPENVLKRIEDKQVNATLLVPTMISFIINSEHLSKYDISCLELLIYGSSPMSISNIEKSMLVFRNTRLYQGYGLTETSPILSILDHKELLNNSDKTPLASAGKVIDGVELKIVDQELNTVNTLEVGEIVVRGNNVTSGYWNNVEATKEVLNNGWLHTGDLGYKDNSDFIYIVDRKKDMIISGGENIFSIEVEKVLSSHPQITDAAVIGIPDEIWGETVHAIINTKNNQDIDEQKLIKYCKENLASYKCPRSIEVRNRPFPLSGVGKVLKAELRKPYWKSKNRFVN